MSDNDRRLRSSRHRYLKFVEDYKHQRLDDSAVPGGDVKSGKGEKRNERRQYLRDYVRWLWPHRVAVGVFFTLALIAAGLQMVEPLFMRFIVDSVLLNTTLDAVERMNRLQ